MNVKDQMKVPFIPEAAPFNEDQRAWLSGFHAGLNSKATIQGTGNAVAADAGTAVAELNILYGTQTGNAETVANDAASIARTKGFAPIVRALDDVSMEMLAAMEFVIVVISTYGEGEMPDGAELFWDALTGGTAPRLETMKYGILALGDTSYDQFCHAGKLIDTRFEQLGAERLAARQDCDIDFEDVANSWIDTALPLMAEKAGASSQTQSGETPQADKPKSKWNRKNPYSAPVINNQLLSGEQSAKEIRHFAFDLAASDIEYEAGDALGVVPQNDKQIVYQVLEYLAVSASADVSGHDIPIEDVLASKLEISTPPKALIEEIASRSGDDELSNIIANGDKEALTAFLWGRDTLDLLNLCGKGAFSADEFVEYLKPLQHRAYSISSSPKGRDREVHITIAAVRWKFEGRQHNGVCSTYLADHVEEGNSVPVFVSPNRSFRVPSDPTAPMIMVGPGTGVAPFRAFLEERREIGASGKNWLFFGDQHRAHDFIYEDEISTMSSDGLLNRLDLAFSRDQSEKVYVQSRMYENGKALFAWLEEGGYFYVCGDATRMARDVDDMLHRVIAENGDMSADAASEYVTNLKREKRYLRDVY